MSADPWDDPDVARQQRADADASLAAATGHAPFDAFAAAISYTKNAGSILEYGCASGYGREILDRRGIPYASYLGLDVSAPALAIARERYPESAWLEEFKHTVRPRGFDVVIDGCSLMHRVDDWREALATMAAASRRWLILHRLPIVATTTEGETHGYGKTFPAVFFGGNEIGDEVRKLGFVHAGDVDAGDARTGLFVRPRHYVTYFDSAYWPKARAMWTSLRRHDPTAILHALCWDADAFAKASEAGMQAVRVDDFLAEWSSLAVDVLPGPRRTRVEHMWTVGPRWCAEVMRMTGEPVTYLDADLFFHNSPETLYGRIGGAAAAVVPHGFAPAAAGLPGPTRESHGPFGLYNVGFVYLGAREVAEDWAAQCRDWCFDRVEEAPIADRAFRYGDQKYLDDWPAKFGAVVLPPHASPGPWAIHTRALDVRGVPARHGGVLIVGGVNAIHFGGAPLVAFHYSSFNPPTLTRPEYALTERQAAIIYQPYMEALG